MEDIRKGFLKMEHSKATINADYYKTEIDIAVYATIKSFMNRDTRQAYPSIRLIAKKLGISKPTVLNAINTLEKGKELSIIRGKKGNQYKFPEEVDLWKKINYEFLDISPLELDATEKGFLICLRRLFHGNTDIINLSGAEIARKLSITYETYKRRLKTLITKGYIKKGDIYMENKNVHKHAIKFDMEKLKLELDIVKEKVDKLETNVVENYMTKDEFKKEMANFLKEIKSGK